MKEMQHMQRGEKAKETHAIVLDFLKHGYSDDSRPFHQKESVVQAIGKDHFTLLELVPVQGINLKPHDEVYIGEEERKEIGYIKGVLESMRITQTAKYELPHIIEKLVDSKEDYFVEFFNNSGPISLRAHSLELLPGVGKRHAHELLAAREKASFKSFEDIKNRVTAMPDPRKAIIARILKELEGGDRYKLFVRV